MSSAFVPTHRFTTTSNRGHVRTQPVRVEDRHGNVCEPVAGASLVTEHEYDAGLYGFYDWTIDESGPRHCDGERPVSWSIVAVAS